MKLLQKSTIINQKNAERKKEIDEGLALARRIDALRETSAKEETNLLTYRATALKVVQDEIDNLTIQADELKQQIKRDTEARKELIKPLDKEWEQIYEEKLQIDKDSNANILLVLQLKEEEQQLEQKKSEISQISARTTKKEQEIDKLKEEINSLKELAQREYELANEERIEKNNFYDNQITKAIGLQKEYESALAIIKIRENEVKEKEVDIIKREKHLASQQKILQIARQQIKK